MAAIDARGRNCPQPVMMTKARVDAGDKEVEVLLDNPVSASNVQRFLEKNGFRIRMMDEDGSIIVRGVKEDSVPAEDAKKEESAAAKEEVPEVKSEQPKQSASRGTALLITRQIFGGNNAMLGEILAKSFLGTLAELSDPPGVVALMNEGVKLALDNTSSCEHLAALAEKGSKILVCGTCTNHFGITSDIGAGVISNMFEITDALLGSDKILTV